MSYSHTYSYYLVKCHQHFRKIDNGGHQLSYALVFNDYGFKKKSVFICFKVMESSEYLYSRIWLIGTPKNEQKYPN